MYGLIRDKSIRYLHTKRPGQCSAPAFPVRFRNVPDNPPAGYFVITTFFAGLKDE